jgi:hypothetical protein
MNWAAAVMRSAADLIQQRSAGIHDQWEAMYRRLAMIFARCGLLLLSHGVDV